MEVILIEDVKNLGKGGEKVQVKDGYARNYLLPRRLALPATASGLKMLKEEERRKAVREVKMQREAEEVAKALNQISCTAEVEAGEDDRVFGAVTSGDIAELLKKQGYDIDKKKIILEEPLKALGVYTIPIKLHTDVEARVKVWVVKKAS
ncbi:MAG: 50S ribosomal protein L9 [bacterium]|jgi:large subunit ribosomal protein L9